MKTMTVLMLSSVAALAVSQYARAEGAAAVADQQAAHEVYQGVDSEGSALRTQTVACARNVTDSG
jgi:hypothetical protein